MSSDCVFAVVEEAVSLPAKLSWDISIPVLCECSSCDRGVMSSYFVSDAHRVLNYIERIATPPLPHPPSSLILGTFGQHVGSIRN